MLGYQLKGEWFKPERQFSLQPLIDALNTYVINFDNWADDERKAHWCSVVGLAQTLIPAHIRHHYCTPEEAFGNNPNLKKPKLERSLRIYNPLEGWQWWSEGVPGLGTDFGVYSQGRYGVLWVGRSGHDAVRGLHAAVADLEALTALEKARTEIDLPKLIERLHTPIENLEDNLDVQSLRF
ncbi:hypothetical protein [Legionella maioricensis]|uniref:SidC homolog n=1 Tax=Legionella maioricensis TaxID=2896528 RepID=A0A9X2D053_9GAMM|nr:hypothetical protein [Legionella maioricensis]MCL9683983.1 hypothetical protein [Legionella maioricensis]MCL9687972.1 hypothetical protein [Legionella maioricensis]